MQCSLGYTYATVASCLSAGGEWRVHETWLMKSTLDRMFDVSASLGSDYHAVWDEYGPHGVPGPDSLGCKTACARLLIITIDDAAAAGPPEMDLFTVRSTDLRGIAIRLTTSLNHSGREVVYTTSLNHSGREVVYPSGTQLVYTTSLNPQTLKLEP